MGGVIKSIFSAPKAPKLAPPPPAPKASDSDIADVVTEERLRRSRASGRQANIRSNLISSISDTQADTRISKLLG